MNKINGYTQEEATGLIEYIYTGRNAGKTLSYLFETYGKEHSRAKGSVRNYYYAFLKRQDDSRVREILNGKDLHANAIRPFTEEETDAMLDKVLAERSKGLSVRRAIMNVSGGDEKLMLRMQNKYRNLLKKQPERVAQAAKAQNLGVAAGRVPAGPAQVHLRLVGRVLRHQEYLAPERGAGRDLIQYPLGFAGLRPARQDVQHWVASCFLGFSC